MARENKPGNPLDQQICDIHRQYLKVFEEQRLDSISDSTKESYLAVLRSLTAKLEVPSKPLSEHARHFSLLQCRPVLPLEGLRPGVDNVRYDVVLSTKFIELARSFIARVLVRHSNMADLAEERAQTSRPPSVMPRTNGGNSKPAEPLDFTPDTDLPFKVFVADVTTDQWERIQRAPETILPAGWKLEGNQIMTRG